VIFIRQKVVDFGNTSWKSGNLSRASFESALSSQKRGRTPELIFVNQKLLGSSKKGNEKP